MTCHFTLRHKTLTYVGPAEFLSATPASTSCLTNTSLLFDFKVPLRRKPFHFLLSTTDENDHAVNRRPPFLPFWQAVSQSGPKVARSQQKQQDPNYRSTSFRNYVQPSRLQVSTLPLRHKSPYKSDGVLVHRDWSAIQLPFQYLFQAPRASSRTLSLKIYNVCNALIHELSFPPSIQQTDIYLLRPFR